MATPAQDKYYLRSLHQEIDLFDRKLAHMLKYDTFATEKERSASADKLKAKRELLARTARQLAADGVGFKDSELPRSFRGDEPVVAVDEVAVALPEVVVAAVPSLAERKRFMPASPFSGTALDARADLEAYRKSKVKTPRTHS